LGGAFFKRDMAYNFLSDTYNDCANEGNPIYGIQYSVITDLQMEPVDIDFFKNHARIDFNTDDALIQTYITAARVELEQWAQLSFGVKTRRLTALQLPKNYQLMFGPVDSITSPAEGFTLLGDIVKEGGKDVVIEYTTKGIINDTIKVAICRYAAGLYAIREHILLTDKGTPVNSKELINEAKDMVRPFANITFL
jgi:hypothetical protein